jgi:hypothetical protein
MLVGALASVRAGGAAAAAGVAAQQLLRPVWGFFAALAHDTPHTHADITAAGGMHALLAVVRTRAGA